MKKLILFTTFVFLSLFAFRTISADPISDPNDVFFVTAPGANQKVSGTINITWRMYDNEQASIQYTAKLYDAASCQNVNYGTINSNLSGTSNKNADNVLPWDTTKTLSSSNLPDGSYCVQVCAALKNGATPYSACNSRIVKIVNHNTPPVITSNPTNLTIHESDSWQYQVTAFDADNDPLTYSLIYGANFLTIDPQTGLIKTNSGSKAVPAGGSQTSYSLRVSVNDAISGAATQDFTLTIVKDQPVTPTPPPGNNGGSSNGGSGNNSGGSTDQPVVNHPAKIDILYPTNNAILKGATNTLKWSITEEDGIKSIKLEYSTESDKNWQPIQTLQSAQQIAFNSLNWDVSKILDGIYYFRITVTDNLGAEVNRVSDNFLIKNQEDQTQSEPLIINLKPDSDSTITTNTPTISADFVASGNGKVLTDSVKIILNNVDITKNCTVSDVNFSCAITQPLEDGKHSVNVTYKDSKDKTASLNWTFTVNTKPQNQTLTQNTITILGREFPQNSIIILVLLCLVFLILAIVPWILYTVWRRNKNKTSVNVSVTSAPVDYSNFGSTVAGGGSFQELSQLPAMPSSFNQQPASPQPQLPPVNVTVETPAPVEATQPTQSEIEANLMDYFRGQGNPLPETPAPQPVTEPAPETFGYRQGIQNVNQQTSDAAAALNPPVNVTVQVPETQPLPVVPVAPAPTQYVPPQPFQEITPTSDEVVQPFSPLPNPMQEVIPANDLTVNNTVAPSNSPQNEAQMPAEPVQTTTQPEAPTETQPVTPTTPEVPYQEPTPAEPSDTTFTEPTPTDN